MFLLSILCVNCSATFRVIGAKVVKTDSVGSNGVIHVFDTMIPPSASHLSFHPAHVLPPRPIRS